MVGQSSGRLAQFWSTSWVAFGGFHPADLVAMADSWGTPRGILAVVEVRLGPSIVVAPRIKSWIKSGDATTPSEPPQVPTRTSNPPDQQLAL
jgi:hypothetical protein